MAIKYNRQLNLPQDNYVMRVIEETFGPSKSSGNPMITLKLEIQHPDEVPIGEESITVAGFQIDHYITTQVKINGEIDVEKTTNCAKRCEDTYKLFGLSFDNFNPENPVLGFKGRLVHVRLYSKETESRKAPTAEQKAQNKPGDLIKNPITNKPVVSYQPSIAEIYGLAEESGAL